MCKMRCNIIKIRPGLHAMRYFSNNQPLVHEAVNHRIVHGVRHGEPVNGEVDFLKSAKALETCTSCRQIERVLRGRCKERALPSVLRLDPLKVVANCIAKEITRTASNEKGGGKEQGRLREGGMRMGMSAKQECALLLCSPGCAGSRRFLDRRIR